MKSLTARFSLPFILSLSLCFSIHSFAQSPGDSSSDYVRTRMKQIAYITFRIAWRAAELTAWEVTEPYGGDARVAAFTAVGGFAQDDVGKAAMCALGYDESGLPKWDEVRERPYNAWSLTEYAAVDAGWDAIRDSLKIASENAIKNAIEKNNINERVLLPEEIGEIAVRASLNRVRELLPQIFQKISKRLIEIELPPPDWTEARKKMEEAHQLSVKASLNKRNFSALGPIQELFRQMKEIDWEKFEGFVDFDAYPSEYARLTTLWKDTKSYFYHLSWDITGMVGEYLVSGYWSNGNLRAVSIFPYFPLETTEPVAATTDSGSASHLPPPH